MLRRHALCGVTVLCLAAQAYERLGRKLVVYKMNPKAMARQQLLGSLNLDTREWTDGVLTAAARKVTADVDPFGAAWLVVRWEAAAVLPFGRSSESYAEGLHTA